MTLREMFWNVNQKSFTERMIANEKIADEFAIGFAKWISKEEYNLDFWVRNNQIKLLLEIFKKEKGL